MAETEIPNLEAIDKESKDYAAQLEAGYISLGDSLKVLQQETKTFASGAKDGLVARLKEAGLPVENMMIKDLEMNLNEILPSQVLALRFKDKEQSRTAEDVTHVYERELSDQMRVFDDRARGYTRVREDFREAILNLTQVELLNTINPENTSVLLYVVKSGDGVYEVQAEMFCKETDLEKKKAIVAKSVRDQMGDNLLSHLVGYMMSNELITSMDGIAVTQMEKISEFDLDAFSDSGYLSDFKATQADVTDKSVYLVTNPTTLVAETVLVEQGIKKAQKTLCAGCPEYDEHVKE